MTRKPTFGSALRGTHFSFSPSFTPLNHGSYGAAPRAIEEKHFDFQKLVSERPDVFMTYKLPEFLDESRKAIAPLLGVPADEVVFVPNATTGVNTVLRNLKFEEGDVIVHFSTIYDSCEKTIASVGELGHLRAANIPLTYPIEDDDIVRKLRDRVLQERKEGKNVKMAMFDTVLTFPGARMPWEDLVAACRELGVLSLIDGAHGIGLIDLTHLGTVSPDFFVSNCHKYVSILFSLRLLLNYVDGSTCLAGVQSSTSPLATSISFGPHCQRPIPIYFQTRSLTQLESHSLSNSLTL